MEWPAFINERTGVYGVLMLIIAVQHRVIVALWREVQDRMKADRERITQLEQRLGEAADITHRSTTLAREAVAAYTGGTQDREVVAHGPPAT